MDLTGYGTEADIAAAFRDALNEGIIDKVVTVRSSGYYKPTEKTGKSRRKDTIYQWQRAAKWRAAKHLPEVTSDKLEPYNEGKTESMKS